MKELKSIRAEIDAIDDELVRLFQRRMEIVAEVAASKLAHGEPITDPAREQCILARVTEAVEEPFKNSARLFFTTLFDISKARQKALMRTQPA